MVSMVIFNSGSNAFPFLFLSHRSPEETSQLRAKHRIFGNYDIVSGCSDYKISEVVYKLKINMVDHGFKSLMTYYY